MCGLNLESTDTLGLCSSALALLSPAGHPPKQPLRTQSWHGIIRWHAFTFVWTKMDCILDKSYMGYDSFTGRLDWRKFYSLNAFFSALHAPLKKMTKIPSRKVFFFLINCESDSFLHIAFLVFGQRQRLWSMKVCQNVQMTSWSTDGYVVKSIFVKNAQWL